MADEIMVYAGFNNDGSLRAWVRDDPRYTAHTAETVAEWIKEGRTVQRMTWAEAHAAMPKPVTA
jgi:hypothetical protein